jgi:SAM-dependent methyltransferase
MTAMAYGQAAQSAGLMGRRAARLLAYLRRRGRRGREAHGIVLMYHRIASLSADPWELAVQPDHFEAQILRGKQLLEVGCGMGYDSLEFLKRGVRVTATDLTENAVLFAARHFEIAGVKPEAVRVENALHLSFPDASFDAVWANGVLHTTGDTQRAVDEVRRVLKPGGRAIISHFYRRPSWM